MPDSPVYRPHDEAPARATFRAIDAGSSWTGIETRGFEYVSRGDFVSGRIHLPRTRSGKRAPLVLLTHGTRQSADSEALGFSADWVRKGFAVATIDLPLHGHRASPKLSERLFRGAGDVARGASIDVDTRALIEEFARQATSDLIRGLDALESLPEVDSARIGIVGLSVGAVVSAYLLAHDDRPRACVFAGGVGRFADRELDPAARLEARGSANACPILVLSIADDPEVSPAAARAFFDAAPTPKIFVKISDPTPMAAGIPQQAAQQAADFLAKHLMP